MIDGQKSYTTHAHDADYIWLAARTDPDAPKHKGISIILVPTSAKGFSFTPIHTLGGERTNVTYYSGVRVPVGNRVGPENMGWTLITSQLNHERITLAAPGSADAMLDGVWDWAGEDALARGRPHARPALGAAEPRARLRQARGPQGAELALGVVDQPRASPTWPRHRPSRCLGTEFCIEVYRLLLEIVEAAGLTPAWRARRPVRRHARERLPQRHHPAPSGAA